MSQRFDPKRSDFEPYGLSVTRWQPTPMSRTDRHNEIELNFVLNQAVRFQIGGRRIIVQPGQVMVFWAAIPHQLVAPICEESYFVATIPLSMFLRFDLPESMVQAMLSGCVQTADMSSVLRNAENRLEDWIADIVCQDNLRLKAMTLELQSLLLRIGAARPVPSQRNQARVLQALNQAEVSAVERIAAYVALHYKQSLTVDQISDAVGLSSGYAMNLFRQVFGQTMMENLLDHRLAHAQRLLISTADPILDIAFASGFGSLSRFNAVFKQRCRCSPRQYRKLHHETCLPPDP